MYYETKMSFLFFTTDYFVTILIPRPQAWFVGFMIHNLFLSVALSLAISNRSKSAGKRYVTGTKL